MDLTEEEHTFLSDLVKSARQRRHHVNWKDRDGTERQTALTQDENIRLSAIAQQLAISKAEVLRQAAHIPVKK
ncbi:MAG TPA: hypothetical protein VKC60_04430 [Opitutaceae bacterium]|nr:hypothetical protein [Opitutaceae bacterium]